MTELSTEDENSHGCPPRDPKDVLKEIEIRINLGWRLRDDLLWLIRELRNRL